MRARQLRLKLEWRRFEWNCSAVRGAVEVSARLIWEAIVSDQGV
jgi:hypothetical protein